MRAVDRGTAAPIALGRLAAGGDRDERGLPTLGHRRRRIPVDRRHDLTTVDHQPCQLHVSSRHSSNASRSPGSTSSPTRGSARRPDRDRVREGGPAAPAPSPSPPVPPGRRCSITSSADPLTSASVVTDCIQDPASALARYAASWASNRWRGASPSQMRRPNTQGPPPPASAYHDDTLRRSSSPRHRVEQQPDPGPGGAARRRPAAGRAGERYRRPRPSSECEITAEQPAGLTAQRAGDLDELGAVCAPAVVEAVAPESDEVVLVIAGGEPGAEPAREAGVEPGEVLDDEGRVAQREQQRAGAGPDPLGRRQHPGRGEQRVRDVGPEARMVLGDGGAVEAGLLDQARPGRRGVRWPRSPVRRGGRGRCRWTRARAASRAPPLPTRRSGPRSRPPAPVATAARRRRRRRGTPRSAGDPCSATRWRRTRRGTGRSPGRTGCRARWPASSRALDSSSSIAVNTTALTRKPSRPPRCSAIVSMLALARRGETA